MQKIVFLLDPCCVSYSYLQRQTIAVVYSGNTSDYGVHGKVQGWNPTVNGCVYRGTVIVQKVYT